MCGAGAASPRAPEPPIPIATGARRSRSLHLPKQTAPEAEADHEGGQQVGDGVTRQWPRLSEEIPKPLKEQTISLPSSPLRTRLEKRPGSPPAGHAPITDTKHRVNVFGDWASFLPAVPSASFRSATTISSRFLHLHPILLVQAAPQRGPYAQAAAAGGIVAPQLCWQSRNLFRDLITAQEA